jgi:hypothetical protein
MGYSRSAGVELVPPEDPPIDLIDEQFLHIVAQRDPIERRLLLWTAALAEAFERDARERVPISGEYLRSYGFLDPDFEANAFGVIVHASPLMGVFSGIGRTLTIGAYSFPVAIRRWNYVSHAPTIDPKNGRSTCWARRKSDSKVGLLTAKHVLDPKILPNADLVDRKGVASRGTVLDLAPDPIDAALIEVTGGPRALSGVQQPDYYVAQWLNVDIDIGAGTLTTKVAHVTDVRGNWGSPYNPARLFLAQAGQPGDSGALVFLSAQQDFGNQRKGEWVGIYTGEQVNAQGQVEGVCQHLGQVQEILKIEVGE